MIPDLPAYKQAYEMAYQNMTDKAKNGKEMKFLTTHSAMLGWLVNLV